MTKLQKIRGSYYKLKGKGKVFYGAYEFLKKSGERTFTLTSSINIKDVKKFSSPNAARAAGWQVVK